MRGHSSVMKLTQKHLKFYITSFSITCCTEQTDIPYCTAELYSCVNTAAVTSDHNEISITSFSITCCTEQTDILYLLAGHYSCVNTAAVTSDHNPNYTHSSSFDGRRCGESRHSI
jgi:hypothetical protein